VYRKIKGAWQWIIGAMASRSLLRRIGIQPAYRLFGDHCGPRLLRFSDGEALHRLIPLTGDRSVCGNTYGRQARRTSPGACFVLFHVVSKKPLKSTTPVSGGSVHTVVEPTERFKLLLQTSLLSHVSFHPQPFLHC
jgi:hypothetical protein